MEQLSLLPKVYEYGENLSSEEMNQIVLHLNSSIEAINYLLARNNGINDGHCEMRYKVSAQLPQAPAAGSDGKSNGWSDTYTKPDTDNGEITWMTLCFLNGDGVYGAWSNPVCITWGSIEGLRGRQGEAGVRGSFKSRVFKRQNSRPDTPTGGTYDNPIPTSGGWTDGIPQGNAIIWSSVCTFHGDGTSSGWSAPAPESDSATLDIEFSPLTIQPSAPIGNIPFANHESEGWYDPNSVNFESAGIMIWRAERKVSNGEYDGDWTITRIYGEKGEKGEPGNDGGHYEFRYNNFTPSDQASSPSKPETGSNGTTGGWTTSQETLTEQQIKDGTATWMTQCYQNENGTYGTWTDPIRITGANGYDGADGNEIEFVYTRNNTGVTPAAPPTTLQEDWTGTVNGVTWTDNPLGVLEDMMYEYVSLRAKINDVWSAYSTPVIWSKWGEKGMDGDGYEYIYKRFTTTQTFTKANAEDATSGNPEDWPASLDREYKGTNTGWSDDPLGIDETYKYEYVSCRQRIDEVWGKFNKPTLWSGIPGGKEEFRYANATSSPTKPTTGTDGTASPWSATQSALTESQIKSGYKTWMTHCFKTDAGTYGTWSNPIRITGANGLDGEDGSDVEFIYKRNNTGSTPSAPTSVNTDDYIPDGWTDNPTGVASNMKYEYVAVREKPAGKNQSWGAYHVALWSKWGEKGMDGDGVEYIFKRFTGVLSWEDNNDNPAHWNVSQSREYRGPSGSGWTDDPTGVNDPYLYEYVSVRYYRNELWGAYSTPALWAKYGLNGSQGGQGPQGPGGKYYVKQYKRHNSRLSVDDSGWSDTAPEPNDNYPYIWERSCLYNPATSLYEGNWSYVCLTGKEGLGSSITGPAGPMYYPAGKYKPGTYTVTDKLVPVVLYQPAGGSYNYYYAKHTTLADPTDSDAWGAFENFEVMFVDVLFASYAHLGAFIINGNYFMSQKGTGTNGTTEINYYDDYDNFNPYLKMNAETGQLWARKGTIGGFKIDDESLGISSSFTNSAYIHKDGYVELRNSIRNYALQVLGGVNIATSSNVNIDVNTGGYVQIGGPNVNINTDRTRVSNGNTTIGNDTNELFVNAGKTTFGSSTPVSVGSSLTVQGPFILSGNTTFITNNSSTAKTVALPSKPSRGQVVFAKGTVGDLTLTGAIRDDEGNTVTSVGGDKKSRIFIYGDSYWNEFYSS